MTRFVMEIECERRQRVIAPVQIVWEEVDSLEQILSKSPHVLTHDLRPGGRKATLQTRWAWGPVKWNLEGEASLLDVRPPHHLTWACHIPGPALRIEARLDLVALGDETNLTYRMQLDARHRFAGRTRGFFGDLVEDNVGRMLARTKARAEQRRLALERLLG